MTATRLAGRVVLSAVVLGLSAWTVASPQAAPPVQGAAAVHVLRVPEGGVQPSVALDESGAAHLVFLKGDAAASDVYYTTIRGDRIMPAVRVNAIAGGAIATGTVRGAQIAIGRGGRVHIAWLGSSRTNATTGGGVRVFYTHGDGTGHFDAERDVHQFTIGADGPSVAADRSGRVFVFWHGQAVKGGDEDHRQLWMAASTDDGARFAREVAVSPEGIGTCGCCGTAALSTPSGPTVLYRQAAQTIHRNATLLTSRDEGRTFTAITLEHWDIGACPMSTFSLADAGARGLVAAWETAGKVSAAWFDSSSGRLSPFDMPPAPAGGRKHPRVAVNRNGTVLLAWAEGTSWGKGGAVAWQLFDAAGHATDRGRIDGLPAWDFAAVYARPDGTFTLLY